VTLKDYIGCLLLKAGAVDLVRRLFARSRITILVYHDPSPAIVRTHLAYCARKYTFITCGELEAAITGAEWRQLPLYPLAVTLDDGHARNAALQGVFQEFGVRPLIYLSSRIVGTEQPFWWQTDATRHFGANALKAMPDVERREALIQLGKKSERPSNQRQALTWDEVKALRTIADFGGHTCTHPILPRCGDAQCEEEITVCKSDIETVIGLPCRHFAYPNGDYGDREIELLKRTGFVTGRTTEPGWNGPTTDRYRLKAMVVSDDASLAWFATQISGVPALLRRGINFFQLARSRMPIRPDKLQSPLSAGNEP
jgi:peptidoglycan/xylan/chitin deacetylase (PgdA/CDA1 family)